MTVNYAELSGDGLAAIAPRAQEVFRQALGYGPMEARVLSFADNVHVHSGRRGVRGVAAADGGRLVGFTYGYEGARGQWWHDQVASALAEVGLEPWIEGSFELAELHVLPAYQGRGIGGRLHDMVLEGLTTPTAVLSTRRGETPAMALYRGRGWEILVDDMPFPAVAEHFRILGLRLSERATRP